MKPGPKRRGRMPSKEARIRAELNGLLQEAADRARRKAVARAEEAQARARSAHARDDDREGT